MGLITSYSDANKQRLQLPITTIMRTLILIGKKAGSESDWAIWSVRTTTVERFKYVGMTEAAADTCVTEMIAAYKNATTNEIEADIEGVHVGGRMWEVNVDARKTTRTTVSEEITP